MKKGVTIIEVIITFILIVAVGSLVIKKLGNEIQLRTEIFNDFCKNTGIQKEFCEEDFRTLQISFLKKIKKTSMSYQNYLNQNPKRKIEVDKRIKQHKAKLENNKSVKTIEEKNVEEKSLDTTKTMSKTLDNQLDKIDDDLDKMLANI